MSVADKNLITQYQGLYGEENANPGFEYLFSELLQTRSSLFDWTIRPHIHAGLFQVFFIQSGSFKFHEVSQEHLHEGPCIVIIPPAALHGFNYSPDSTGRILTLSDSLLHGLFPATSSVLSMFSGIRRLTKFLLPNSPEHLLELFEAIDDEIFNDYEEKRMMVGVCLQRLFLALYRLYRQNEISHAEPDNRSLMYFRNFQKRVREGGATKSIVELASELAITPVHLNRICRSVAGKSAIEIIHEHLLEEAKKYLVYTSHNVSEIAYLLHFEYPNYFARFFKKNTGMTPTQFRESQKGII